MPRVPDLSGSALDDRYELHAVIGEGAFGRVYEGRDRRLDRPVAVKVIKPWWADDPEWVATFERETRLLARVSDPGIVQIYDVGNAPQGRYYVSELVRGSNLAQRLADGPIAPWEAAEIAAQLCRALAAAHARRIVHRDVKPPNILLSADGEVKVGDFGVAGLAEGSSGAGSQTIVGTPAYMAPEQSRGRAATPATDVYSAGVVLYEMLAGKRPFAAELAVDLALCHLYDPPPPLPATVPEPLQRIVTRALAKDPATRYRDCGEMADALVDARRRAAERGRRRAESVGARLLSGSRKRRAGLRPPVSARAAAGTRVGAGAGPGGAAGTATLDGPGDSGRSGESRSTGRESGNRLASDRASAARQAGHASAGSEPAGQPGGRQAPRWAPTPPRRPGQTVVAHRPGDTRPGPLVSPRTNHNPPARRRAIGALVAAFAVVGGGLAVALLAGSGSGAHRATIPRTRVPDVRGMSSAAATARLRRNHLHVHMIPVAWPGHAAGSVRAESRVAKWLRKGSTVTLRVAEVPSWKTVTRFTGKSSPVFQIEGSRFRLVYDVRDEKSCTLWIFCSRSSAEISDTGSGNTVDTFDLSDGNHQTQVFDTGPGSYQVKVDPASGDARWSFTVQDWY
ncbi:MAG TPA: serine/threonine protein kinase [Solirubrobacteraceae bacterium]|nr:serine/threonine protein kinase [Solirubrobacteraceae bacterium]